MSRIDRRPLLRTVAAVALGTVLCATAPTGAIAQDRDAEAAARTNSTCSEVSARANSTGTNGATGSDRSARPNSAAG
jgi:hypothetical protein